MYGKNEVSSPMVSPIGELVVNDIFYTLQGEGPDAGKPAVFVRLSKCNLRCYFCDTEFERGQKMRVEAIRDRVCKLVEHSGCQFVVITGGEPLLQNIAPFVRMLNTEENIEVSVETAGTVWRPVFKQPFQYGNKIICSPKTPKLNEELINYVRAWKYIVNIENTSKEDGLPIMSTQIKGEEQKLFRPPKHHAAPIFIQAMDEGDAVKNLANLSLARDLAMKHGYRLSVQMHKLPGIGLP